MAKRNKKFVSKKVLIAIVAVAAFLVFGSIFLLGPSLTGQAVVCARGNHILSVHVDANDDGSIVPLNNARVILRSANSACVYETVTNINGNTNILLDVGKYKATISKTGKCDQHTEHITVTGSDLINFRLTGCGRNFNT